MDLTIDDPRWGETDLESLATIAVNATLARFALDPEDCELSLLACDDTAITTLNAEFRDKPQPTNVLSWPAVDLAPEIAGAAPEPPEPDFTGEIPLGDIAIAFDTCQREAAEADKPFAHHVTHLIIHGVLHLLGFDHIRDADATLMETIEVEILGNLGIDDPYNGK